jgi:hypothetical protein
VTDLLRETAQAPALQDAPAVVQQDEIVAVAVDLMKRDLLHVNTAKSIEHGA